MSIIPGSAAAFNLLEASYSGTGNLAWGPNLYYLEALGTYTLPPIAGTGHNDSLPNGTIKWLKNVHISATATIAAAADDGSITGYTSLPAGESEALMALHNSDGTTSWQGVILPLAP